MSFYLLSILLPSLYVGNYQSYITNHGRTPRVFEILSGIHARREKRSFIFFLVLTIALIPILIYSIYEVGFMAYFESFSMEYYIRLAFSESLIWACFVHIKTVSRIDDYNGFLRNAPHESGGLGIIRKHRLDDSLQRLISKYLVITLVIVLAFIIFLTGK